MRDERSVNPCQSCGGRGEKLRSSRRLVVVAPVEGDSVPVRVDACLDCGGSGLAAEAA